MSCQRVISGALIRAPTAAKLTPKRKRVQARHRPWHKQSDELYKYCPELLSLDELLIRQLFYKYHNSLNSNKFNAPYKQSSVVGRISNVIEDNLMDHYSSATPQEACAKRQLLPPHISSSSSCSINKKVSTMESSASCYSKSSTRPSKASSIHLEFSARDRSRLDLSSSSRYSQVSHRLRLDVSTSSHCSNVSRRLQKLAQSKQSPKVVSAKQPWQLTWSMRTFQPSERLLKLACSRMPSAGKFRNPFLVSHRALTYKATERINLLAVPRKTTPTDDEHLQMQSRPIPKVLLGQLTPRLENLATPKRRQDTTIRRKPYTVRRRAMRAKLTPRLEKLAQPRQQRSGSGSESLRV